jgi:hypothetical protein
MAGILKAEIRQLKIDIKQKSIANKKVIEDLKTNKADYKW